MRIKYFLTTLYQILEKAIFTPNSSPQAAIYPAVFMRKLAKHLIRINAVLCLVAQSCLTLCDPMDCSLPGSSVHEDSPGGMLEWVAMPSSKALGYLGLPKFLHKCFPGGSRIKNSPANAGDMDSITQSRRSPGGGNGNLLQYSCLENRGA